MTSNDLTTLVLQKVVEYLRNDQAALLVSLDTDGNVKEININFPQGYYGGVLSSAIDTPETASKRLELERLEEECKDMQPVQGHDTDCPECIKLARLEELRRELS